MSIAGIATMSIGLCCVLGAGYGYKTAKDANDDQKKKVYTGLGIVACLVILAGIIIIMMGGSGSSTGKDATGANSLPNDPKQLANLRNKTERLRDNIETKIERVLVGHNEPMRILRRDR